MKLAAQPTAQLTHQAIDESFKREEEALRQIVHPNVVSLANSGLHEGRRFLVLEYIEGETVWNIYNRDQSSHSAHIAAKIQILAGLADGLHSVHSNGFVHLDVKPENVMVPRKGEPN